MSAEQNVVIKEDKLSELAAQTGSYLQKKLEALSATHPEFISSIRGKGTIIAFDVGSTELRDKLIGKLKSKGII